MFSGFSEAFAVEVNVNIVGQELSDDEDKRKRDEEAAADAELLQRRSSSSAQQQHCEDTSAPFVAQVLLCAEYAAFLSSFFSMKWFVEVTLPVGTLPCRWRYRGVGHDRGLRKGAA